MPTLSYPAYIEKDIASNDLLVRFPDFAEALTSGQSMEDALSEAEDCLQEAIAGRIVRKENIPSRSRVKRGQYSIPVALYLAPKLALYQAMRETALSNRELARRLGVTEVVVRRLLNPKHDSRPEKIEAALQALGKQIVVQIMDAA
jgi:antitoxin HicB